MDKNELSTYLEMLKLSGVHDVVIPGAPELSVPVLQPPREGAPVSGDNRKEIFLSLREEVRACTLCDELAKTRTQTVFGAGHIRAGLVFVGEAPGYDEDQQGLPFVGKAGQLLTKMIEAIGMNRKEVFICNVLKCRPPQNRNPKPEEVVNCSQYLWKQLSLIQPKIICALGNFASQTLLGTTQTISKLRGSIHETKGFRIICTFHPAYLLRNPDDKGKAWEDLKRVREELSKNVVSA